MSRMLLTYAMLIIFVLTLIGFMIRIVGSTQQPSLVMRGFTERCTDQPQPCWYGIVPGITTRADLQEKVLRSGYSIESITTRQLDASLATPDACQKLSVQFGSHVQQVKIKLCNAVLLGDLVRQFGQPDNILLDPLSIGYRGEILMLFGKNASSDAISYWMPLQEVIFLPANSQLPQLRQPWLDVLVQRKYCDLIRLRVHCRS